MNEIQSLTQRAQHFCLLRFFHASFTKVTSRFTPKNPTMRLSLWDPGLGLLPKGISAIPFQAFDAKSEFEVLDLLSKKLAATSEGATGIEQPIAVVPSNEPTDLPMLDAATATAVPEPELEASECIAGQGPDSQYHH